MLDLKRVYTAPSEETALSELEQFDVVWGKKYPKIVLPWRKNWAELPTFFKYPEEVRKLIYTANAIEGSNRQLRKVTKNKGVFPTDDSLFKMLYLATVDTKKWTGRRHDWGRIFSQLSTPTMEGFCYNEYFADVLFAIKKPPLLFNSLRGSESLAIKKQISYICASS